MRTKTPSNKSVAPYEDTETLELLDDVRAAEAEIERGEVYPSDEVSTMLKAE